MTAEQNERDGKPGHDHDDQFVKVSISTTAGFFPEEGFNRVPVNQKVEVELKQAQKKLGIKDVEGWIATVTADGGKRDLDVTKGFRDNKLSGQVEIDWGPSEGGGG